MSHGETYLAGKPCANGDYPCRRFVSCDECVDCKRAARARRHAAHGEDDRQYLREYRETHAEELHSSARQRYLGGL